ncbi:MAG: deoxyguanosinetriphosphate triphosphohydrolase [Rhodoluna sp.]
MNAEVGYSDFDRERFLPEVRKSTTSRGEFARDRARVLHSSALRRLGAKTQVLSPSSGDFARTRLTHSLEVAQVGREMAAELGLNPEVVDMACLAHDLGHPPFGHNGEMALHEWARGIGGFEGNSQTLRLLTRIEPKVFSAEGRSLGLNLTRASLDATCKYPWTLSDITPLDAGSESYKFGVYQDDLDVFRWMREGAAGTTKCIEAQVMDFADDVAYSVHDFEDAIVSGHLLTEQLLDLQNREEVLSQIAKWSGGAFENDELAEAFEALAANEYWLHTYEGSSRDLGALKNLTSSFIGSFVADTTARTLETHSGSSLTRYQASLVVPDRVGAEIAVLKGIVAVFVMTHESRRGFYERQRQQLTELSDALLAKNGENLDAYCSAAWREAGSEQEQLRVIVDQVASLTDQSALAWHALLCG